MMSAIWCEPSRRRHVLPADWHGLKAMVSAVMWLRQLLVLVVLRRTVAKGLEEEVEGLLGHRAGLGHFRT